MTAYFKSRAIVDWISFTMKRDIQPDQSTGALLDEIMGMVFDYPELAWLIGNNSRSQLEQAPMLELTRGRFPYDKCFVNRTSTLRVYFGHEMPHVLVEITGQACSALGHKRLMSLLLMVECLVTRIDLAVDVECPDSPKEVLDSIPVNRFRSTGHIISDTGETVYIGSQKSDRFARVYRYNEPHPRAHYMRYEMVTKAQNAKNTAKSINLVGIEATAGALGNAFHWTHGTWQLRSKDSIEVHRPERNRAKTERWFYKTVLPALKKMLRDGTLTADELLSSLDLDTL